MIITKALAAAFLALLYLYGAWRMFAILSESDRNTIVGGIFISIVGRTISLVLIYWAFKVLCLV